MKTAIINLRGTNGTGKSTVAHAILKKSAAQPLELWPNTRKPKPKVYAGTWKGVPIHILGSYETVCGGMDTITDINDAAELICQYGKEPGILFYEGLFISHCLGTVAKRMTDDGLKDVTELCYLDTPLETCLERVRGRRAERGVTKPFKEQNVIDDFQRVEWNYSNAKRQGWNVVDVPHGDALAFITKKLDKAAAKFKKENN